MIHEHSRATCRLGPELRQHRLEVVDALEVLDDDTLDPQVVAPHPLDQLGVVATLHEDAARLGYPGARFGNRE